MTPRPYQERALVSARQCFAQGARSVVIVSPTGSGKTFMGAMVATGHLSRPERRVVWLAHRTELIDQAAATLRAFGLDVSVRGANPSAPVQVESVQTILARKAAPEGSILIADECHHFCEDNRCGDITTLYPRMLGLTATPERGDGKPLKPPFDALVVAAQIAELTAAGHLVPLRIKWPGRLLGKRHLAERPVDWYLEHARGTRAICFAPNLTAAGAYRDDFVAMGVRCAVVDGKMRKDARASVIGQHRTGQLDVLVNCGVLTEGYDDPLVSCVIVARGCGSQGLWLQMVGRGLRPAEGKEYCLLLDMRGLTGELGRPDADRDFALDGTPIQVSQRNAANGERVCRKCKAPLGDMVRCPECFEQNELIPAYQGVKAVDYDEIKANVREGLKTRRDAISLAGMIRKYRSREQVVARFRGIFKRQPDDECWRQATEYNRVLGVESARAEEERHRATQA